MAAKVTITLGSGIKVTKGIWALGPVEFSAETLKPVTSTTAKNTWQQFGGDAEPKAAAAVELFLEGLLDSKAITGALASVSAVARAAKEAQSLEERQVMVRTYNEANTAELKPAISHEIKTRADFRAATVVVQEFKAKLAASLGLDVLQVGTTSEGFYVDEDTLAVVKPRTRTAHEYLWEKSYVKPGFTSGGVEFISGLAMTEVDITDKGESDWAVKLVTAKGVVYEEDYTTAGSRSLGAITEAAVRRAQTDEGKKSKSDRGATLSGPNFWNVGQKPTIPTLAPVA